MSDATNPGFDPNFNMADFINQKKKDKGLAQAGQEGKLTPSLFTYEQASAGVPEAIATPKDYSWDKVVDDDKFINTMKDFYEIRDDIKFDDDDDKRNRQDIVDYFVSDRTWKQANLYSAGKDLAHVYNLTKEKDGAVSQENIEQLQRLYYGMNYWENIHPDEPTATGKIKHYGSRTLHNLYAGTLDWTNLFSLGVGLAATKIAGKTAVAQTANFTIKQYLKKYAMKTAAPVVAFDAATMAGFDLMNQKKTIEMGIQEEIDPVRTGFVALMGAGISVLPTTAGTYAGVKVSLTKNRKIPTNALIQSAEMKVIGTPEKGKYQSVIGTFDQYKAGGLDKFHPWKITQEWISGVPGSVKGLKKAKEGIYLSNKGFTTIIDNKVYYAPAVDPVSLAYFQWRLTTASTTRAHHATMENGVLFLPDKSALKFGYTPSGNPGINVILKEFDEVGEAENFLMYAAAKRAYHMHVMNRTGTEGFTPFFRDFPQGKDVLPKDKKYLNIPFSEAEAIAIIDRAEMDSAAYKTKYGIELDRTLKNKNGDDLNFTKSLTKLKKHTDDILELSRQAGIISDDQVARIKAANPDGFIPFYGMKNEASYPVSPTNVVAVGSKVKKKTKRGELAEGEAPEMVKINGLYDSLLDYTYSAVIAADRNRAKIANIDLLDAGVEKGILLKTKDGTYVHAGTNLPIYQEVSGATVKYNNILKADIIKKLQNQGYKVTKDDVQDLAQGGNIQGATFVSTIRDGNDLIDIVYVDGKAKFYKVLDPTFVNMYRDPMFSNYLSTSPKLSKLYEGSKLFTKIPSKLITLSPRFASKNIFRDTFTGVVNSQFGFIPLWSTGMGFVKTFAGTESFSNAQNKTLMQKYIGMFERSQMYNDFLRQGGGFASRNQTEKFFNGPRWEMYLKETGKATKDYKTTINGIRKMIRPGTDGWVEIIGRLEYASRLAEYSYARKTGLSPVAAAFAGREISTDFGMHGSNPWLQEYNAHTMFFNAGLQGFYKMSRTLAEDPIRSAAIIGGVFVAPEVALWTLLNGREEYEELSDEYKMMNYTYPVFKEGEYHENGDQVIDFFIAWPRPFDYQFAPNTARGILESIKRDNPGTALKYALHSLQSIMPGFTTPTAINPWFSIWLNENWQGDKIIPQHLLGKIPDEQVKKTTRLSAIKIANGIKWAYSPFIGEGKEEYMPISSIKIDYIMNTYMAGLGQIPLDLIDAGIYRAERYEKIEGKKVDVLGPRPLKQSDQVDIMNNPMSFVTSTFKVNTPIRNNERVNKFYEIHSNIKKIKATEIKVENYEQIARNLKKILLGDAEHQMENESQERKDLRDLSPTFDAVMEMIKLQQAEKAFIEFDSDLSAQEKADQILEINTAITEAIREVVIDVRDMDLDTIDVGFFGKENRSEKSMDLFGTRKSLKKGTEFINKAVEQSMELFN